MKITIPVSLALLLAAAACGCTPAGVTTAPATVALIRASAGDATQLVDSASDVARRLDSYLASLEALGFSGAIIAEHEGRVVLRKGYGLADRETRRPYTPGTVQDILSVTKPFTAAAILLLESRGELRAEDPITRFFDNVPAEKRGITVHHLLTHQSGWPGAIGRDAEPIDSEAFVARAMQTPLGFEPGTAYDYSNVGYSLLGIIIERVSGRGYEQFLREELLLPAAMPQTGYVLPEWSDTALAFGYREGELYGRTIDQGWLPDGPGWNLRANGGLHSTVGDMHRWLDVLRGQGPLSPALVERWTTGYVDEGGGSSYGYGWEVAESELGRIIAHNGGNPAFSSDFVWLPDQRFFFYAQGNNSLFRASRLREVLVRAAFDPEFELPPVIHADQRANPVGAAGLAGEYRLPGGSITLTADDTRLLAVLEGQGALDAMLDHTAAERTRFAQLNERTASVMSRIRAGREDALEGMVSEGTNATERARSLIRFLERGGELRSTTVLGSVANVPGSRFAQHGGYTTFVRVEFPNRVAILSVLWREDETYRGGTMGPISDVPGFVFVPATGGGYTAIERDAPWRIRTIVFEENCLEVGEMKACRE